MMRLRAVAVVLLLLALPAHGPAHTAIAQGRLPSGLGVHVHVWQTGPEDLDRIKRFGFSFVRWGIAWDAVEKTPGEFDWAATDAFIERVRQAGLPSLVILGTGNPLYGPWVELPRDPGVRERRVPAPPEDDAARAAFGRFAAAAARRYADHAVTWEIWNEPDSRIFWPPAPRRDAYARLVAVACSAIKDAVPAATVIAPATAALPNRVPRFYHALSETGAASCIDGLSMHSYRIGGGVQPDPESVERDNLASRAVLDRLAARWQALPMLCSEWGYPSSAVGAEVQLAHVARTYLANLASGVAATVWYEWKDSRDEPANPESHFGLLTTTGAPKARLEAAPIQRLLGMRYVRRLETGRPDVQALLFDERGVEHVVAWLRSDDPRHTVDVRIGDEDVTLQIMPSVVRGRSIRIAGHAR